MRLDLPIACSLTVTELPARLAEMSAIGQAGLLSAETTGTQATLRFRCESGTRERLAAVVAAEAECCPFLNMTLTDEPDAIELIIDAPTGAEPVLDDLVAAFTGTSEAM
jgi:hypothetical protein